jgi:hypothetical protein
MAVGGQFPRSNTAATGSDSRSFVHFQMSISPRAIDWKWRDNDSEHRLAIILKNIEGGQMTMERVGQR